MTIKKLPLSLSHLCAYSALWLYMDLHVKDYEHLNTCGVWLHYKGNAEVIYSTLAQDTHSVLILTGIPKQFCQATVHHAMSTYWLNKGIPINTVMDHTSHHFAILFLCSMTSPHLNMRSCHPRMTWVMMMMDYFCHSDLNFNIYQLKSWLHCCDQQLDA